MRRAKLDTRDVGGLSCREIAAILGISKSRVAQIEAEALGKMRREAERIGIDLAELLAPEARADALDGGLRKVG